MMKHYLIIRSLLVSEHECSHIFLIATRGRDGCSTSQIYVYKIIKDFLSLHWLSDEIARGRQGL